MIVRPRNDIRYTLVRYVPGVASNTLCPGVPANQQRDF
jgi:hypothetical protein